MALARIEKFVGEPEKTIYVYSHVYVNCLLLKAVILVSYYISLFWSN